MALTTVGDAVAAPVSAKVTEGLLEYDYDIKPRPAARHRMVDQSRRQDLYASSSRPNVKFHDGKPFTSADVAYSIQLLKTVHPRGRNTVRQRHRGQDARSVDRASSSSPSPRPT